MRSDVTAKSPDDIDRAFAEAFNAGNGEAVLSLYEPESVFVLPSGEVIQGPAAIGEALGSSLAMTPRINLQTERIIRAGDTALVYSSWTQTICGPDGNTVQMSGNSRVVVREQVDGTWKFVIDDPGWND